MSNREDKKARSIAEAAKFVNERHQTQMAIFEANFETGKQIFLTNKENMTPEDIEVVEKEMAGAQELMDKLKLEWGL